MRNFIRNSCRRFLGESGAASVEFVIVFPIFFTVFVSAFELAMMNTRAVLLERATDIVVRDIRLNQGADYEYADIRDGICEMSFAIPGCGGAIKIEMTPVSTDTWGTLPTEVDCINRQESVDPIVNFTNGVENELMLANRVTSVSNVRLCSISAYLSARCSKYQLTTTWMARKAMQRPTNQPTLESSKARFSCFLDSSRGLGSSSIKIRPRISEGMS